MLILLRGWASCLYINRSHAQHLEEQEAYSIMCRSFAVLLLLLAALAVDHSQSKQRWNYKSLHLRQTIFGPTSTGEFCTKTPQTLQRDFNNNCTSVNLTNCEDAWNGFSGAFRGREPYKVTARWVQLLNLSLHLSLIYWQSIVVPIVDTTKGVG